MIKLEFLWDWIQMLSLWCKLYLHISEYAWINSNLYEYMIYVNFFNYAMMYMEVMNEFLQLWSKWSLILRLYMYLFYFHDSKLIECEHMLLYWIYHMLVIMHIFMMVYWWWEHIIHFTLILMGRTDSGSTPPTLHLL